MQNLFAGCLFSPGFLKFLRVNAVFFHFGVKCFDRFHLVLLHDVGQTLVQTGFDFVVETDLFGLLDQKLFIDQTCDEFALLFVNHFLDIFPLFALLHFAVNDILDFAFYPRKRDHAVIDLRNDLIHDTSLGFLRIRRIAYGNRNKHKKKYSAN